ncbi:xanthine dehydrogenase family protein subunit M [Hymenobacter sp. BT186]|uniref:Xanthine dehydrogenase family protein subunit M n=1 Tax=Hymenobacter telluris TaxID=2816474 RepID=A0A939F1C9_9BACT|nr:xanthine dehydrogenase family protein subunit M [Hymenobacter telluris]MBO0360547.1 xanthine dehydrogenase family protein subunit M [Hymenobacter telluris]MBW3376574.1 xanthine dehydrogenase family protein subunit M [Hymenobacter norwichensis]
MYPFQYQRATTPEQAVAAVAKVSGAAFVAGGTSQLDLMKEDVLRPSLLVDVSPLPLKTISAFEGGLRLGAGVSNTAAAIHPEVQARYPAVSEALLAGASTQIRNMASMGGNPLQRTRCPYFRDPAQPCNKREPGTGCAALKGLNRVHAIFGASTACVATHPSDLAVALAALDAQVQVTGPGGTRTIAFPDLHRLPGDTPQQDTTLVPGELITSIDLPSFTGRSHYLKVRERASYAFALVSCAVALEMDGKKIRRARVALGGVAHKPWRVPAAEALLAGKKPSEKLFRAATEVAFADAKPLEHNAYKLTMGRNLMLRALLETSGLQPLQGPAGTAFAASVGGVGGE